MSLDTAQCDSRFYEILDISFVNQRAIDLRR